MQPTNPTTAERPIQLHWHEARQAQHYGRGLLLRPMLSNEARPCPYGQVGDVRWVQETWNGWGTYDGLPSRKLVGTRVAYAADMQTPLQEACGRLRPSALMPRWASRLTIRITGVRALPFSQISEPQATAAGIDFLSHGGVGLNWAIGGATTRDPVFALAWWFAKNYWAGTVTWAGGDDFYSPELLWRPCEPMAWFIGYEVIA